MQFYFVADRGNLDFWVKLAFVNANSPVPPTFKTQIFKILVWILFQV